MDVTSISNPHESGSNPLGRALAVQHERIRDFLAAQRQRVERIEAELAARVQQCQTELSQRQAELEAREQALLANEDAWRAQQHELELAARQQELDRGELDALRQACVQRSADLDARQEQLESLRLHTESQRRRIARELRAQQLAQRAELNRLREESERAVPDGRPSPEPQASKPLAAAPKSSGGGLNWEAEKRRILAALEREDEGSGDDGIRMEVEEVIRVTERALADKDRELAEMRQILDTQSSNLGQVAVGAAALGDLLDRDELISEEREHLKRLQQEWEEKLRQAEIDISLERAKIARQRAELEEKVRAYEQHSQEAEPPEKKTRGRWLARLGLKDEDPNE
jgi:hypothetical protein